MTRYVLELEGFESRPLYVDDDGHPTEVLEHAEVFATATAAAIAGAMLSYPVRWKLIGAAKSAYSGIEIQN